MTKIKKFVSGQGAWIIIIGLLLSLAAALFYLHAQQREEQAAIKQIQTIYAERTENLINSIFHKTDVLAAVVKLENGDISEDTFEDVAQIVYQKNAGIRGIQYMPGAVVTYSYPLAGNEAVMGKNFLEIPERKKDVMLAINTRSIALSGPYTLIQGGLGVVARNPVFLKDASGKEYFWGFSAIILDLPDALASVGLEQLSESGYNYQLYCVNENQEKLVIDGDPSLDLTRCFSGTISVPHHEWTLALSQKKPWVSPLLAVVIFCVGLLVTVALRRFYCLILRERAAVQAKDQFFSNISHDMRTPLNAVLGFTALARQSGTSEAEKEDYLAKIDTSGRLLLDLVNDTLTLSKASNGKIVLRPEPCSTQDMEASIITPIRALAEKKNITFTSDSTGVRSRTVLADRVNAEKIFLNLLTNAVKYTPAGGHVAVVVRDDPADAPDPDFVFVIRDDGIGMSEDFLTRVFEPFAQENRPGYESNGTGLGLAIVKQLVDLFGGTIEIKSRMNEGTTITVRLHFPETDAGLIPEKKPDPVSPDILQGRKVLLCEDNAMNREIAVLLLKKKGMDVVCAVNGRLGVDCFKDSAPGEFDVILMDLRMPVMNGLEASAAIRALDRPDAETVPIIAMTADAFTEDVDQCKRAGMNGHIAKPVDPAVMYSILAKALRDST